MLIRLRLLRESFNFAINALRNNKLRTFLSLLGVTIGIFSIIAVLAAVDSLQRDIKGSLGALDNSTIVVMRFSFGPTEVPQWKLEQFPDVNYEEYQFLKRSMGGMEAISYVIGVPRESLKYEGVSSEDVDIGAVTSEYYHIEAFQLDQGRLFNESESVSGTPVIVLGHEVGEIFSDN